jgi:hypothetical protein
MKNSLVFSLLASIIFFISQAQASDLQPLAPAALGLATPLAISGSPQTLPIRMGGIGTSGYYTRLTLIQTIVWGTTAQLDLKCKASSDGVSYSWIQSCEGTVPYDCKDRVWRWVAADGTTPALDIETNYAYMICQWTGTGTGTVTASAIKGR